MKRRNADCSKLRRPLKRNRITEGIYGSTFLYLKFLVVWALVLLADFVLEFRFEYLWPFWLFIRSVYDSFRYQGLLHLTTNSPVQAWRFGQSKSMLPKDGFKLMSYW
uniref:Macoilin n=1 Tax=Mus musculus TaxID=10090 RepID=E0CZE6_MOUSE